MILIFDLGTQSFRASLLGPQGERLFESVHPVASRLDGPLAEQDPEQWVRALHAAVDALRRDGPPVSAVRGIACSATLAGLVCLDAAGRVLRPALLYADRRPAPHAARVEALPSFQPIARRLGWRVYSGDFLPQLAYLRADEPETYRRASLLLDATGYLNFLLTGRATLDRYTAYSCYADPDSDELSPLLLRDLAIDRAKLGRSVEPGARIAPLRPELAEAWGMPEAGVFSVSYDSAAAYLGAPLNSPGEALDISGTVTSFGVVCRHRVVDAARRIHSLPYRDGEWMVRGSTALSGGVLEWARRTVTGGGFPAFDEAVAASTPGAGGVTFLPYLQGARAPLFEPSACGVFYGLSPQTTRADMARAVYEGVCYSLRHIVEVIESCGAPVSTIRLGGGLARNALLNQMKADITGRPVCPLSDPEITTLGAATVVARGLGWLPAGGSFVKDLAPLPPDEALGAAYRQSYLRYRSLADHLAPYFRRGVPEEPPDGLLVPQDAYAQDADPAGG